MNKGTMANVHLGIGNHGRYSTRLMGGYFNSDMRVMLFNNMNNTATADSWRRWRRQMGRQPDRLNASKMFGVNFNYEKKNKLILDGSVRWNHSNNDTRADQSTENFVGDFSSFSNNLNQSYSRRNNWNFQMRVEWNPDSMTTILFRPTFSLSSNDGRKFGNSASYSDDPYKYVDDPLSDASIAKMEEEGVMVNSEKSRSISYGDNKNLGGTLQVNRRLSNDGRNITLRPPHATATTTARVSQRQTCISSRCRTHWATTLPTRPTATT